MNVTLNLDDETIARLNELGTQGRASSMGNEILGMALTEAWQNRARLNATAERMQLPVRKVPATTKRPTYAGLMAMAAERGVVVQSHGRKIRFWRKGEEHTEGECDTIAEAWCEIESGAI